MVSRMIFRRFLRRRPIFSLLFGGEELQEEAERKERIEIPKPIFEYAKRMAEFTGQPLREVLKSKPVQNLIKKYEEKVVVEI